jgi:hypothetical protein
MRTRLQRGRHILWVGAQRWWVLVILLGPLDLWLQRRLGPLWDGFRPGRAIRLGRIVVTWYGMSNPALGIRPSSSWQHWAVDCWLVSILRFPDEGA